MCERLQEEEEWKQVCLQLFNVVLKKKRRLIVNGTKYIYLFKFHTWQPDT